MSKFLFLITAILMSTALVQAQSESKTVSLENWDVGAVKVITEPKPEPVSKNKAANDKPTAAAKKPGTVDAKNDKTAATAQGKTADKSVASTKETSKDFAATLNVVDLNTIMASTATQT